MEFLSILFVIGALVLSWFIAKEFQRIAEMKGHGGKRYFWWSFFTSAAGWAMVIALPDRLGTAEAAALPNDELPEL